MPENQIHARGSDQRQDSKTQSFINVFCQRWEFHTQTKTLTRKSDETTPLRFSVFKNVRSKHRVTQTYFDFYCYCFSGILHSVKNSAGVSKDLPMAPVWGSSLSTMQSNQPKYRIMEFDIQYPCCLNSYDTRYGLPLQTTHWKQHSTLNAGVWNKIR